MRKTWEMLTVKLWSLTSQAFKDELLADGWEPYAAPDADTHCFKRECVEEEPEAIKAVKKGRKLDRTST